MIWCGVQPASAKIFAVAFRMPRDEKATSNQVSQKALSRKQSVSKKAVAKKKGMREAKGSLK